MGIYTLDTVTGEGELPIRVEFEFSAGMPAKVDGPMEDCYPAEDYDLAIVEIMAMPCTSSGYDISDIISSAETSRLEQCCLDYITSINGERI
jgi:hypothetical protein